MSITAAIRIQLKNAVEHVLHVQGNYTGGILEMAIVIDRNLPKEEAAQRAKDLVQILKSQNEIFRNVRLILCPIKAHTGFIGQRVYHGK